ncbi:ribokinase [Ornithinibacillus californiensis]|uniref:ribokinase n=1 Tax=Ornithinibacillus californiensis TaxID=161536 RepID=UPI00064D9C28|nr:ribokinase [Ornithinibacillus californiensis]
MRVAVIGSVNIDLVYDVAHIVKPGETISSSNSDTFFGGKGANQAVAMAQLGADVDFVGCVGQDDFGKRAIENLDNYGISTNHVHQFGITGNALIQVSQTGENAIVLMEGANSDVKPVVVKEARELIKSADAVLMQLEIPLESVVTGMMIARESQVPVILNPAPAQPLAKDMLSLVDVLTPNETELAILSGMEVSTNQSIEDASHLLIEQGVKTVVVTLGDKGAYFTNGKESGWVPARNVQAVDTTGAGDAFNGALTVGLCRNLKLVEAIQYAVNVSGYVVTQKGAQVKIPTDLSWNES